MDILNKMISLLKCLSISNMFLGVIILYSYHLVLRTFFSTFRICNGIRMLSPCCIIPRGSHRAEPYYDSIIHKLDAESQSERSWTTYFRDIFCMITTDIVMHKKTATTHNSSYMQRIILNFFWLHARLLRLIASQYFKPSASHFDTFQGNLGFKYSSKRCDFFQVMHGNV